MRDLEFFVIILVLIMLGMYGLYSVGSSFEYGLNCKNCEVSTPLTQLPDIKDKIIYFLTFIPLFIFTKLNLQLSSNSDINFALGLTLAFFLFFASLIFVYWLLRQFLALIFKVKQTTEDSH